MGLHELRRAVVLEPDSAEAQFSLAEALFCEGELEGARRHVERVLLLSPRHENGRSLLARLHEREAKQPLARGLLEGAVRNEPQNARARIELAAHLEAEGRLDDAILHARVAARLQPHAPDRLLAVAELSRRAGLPEQALAATRQLLAGFPTHSRAAELRRELLLELGMPESAEVLLGPLSGQAVQLLQLPAVGAELERSGLRAVAEALATGSVAAARRVLVLASPDSRRSGAGELLRGELLLLDGDHAGAVGAFERAMVAGLPLAGSRLGDLLVASGELEPAAAKYKIALGTDQGLVADRLVAVAWLQRSATRRAPAAGRIGAVGWHPLGGRLHPLEAVVVPGAGALHVSGNAGAVLRETSEVAFSYLKACARSLGIHDRFRSSDLHLHFVDSEVGKDGSSFGLAVAIAGISAYTSRPLLPALAATGDITLSGEVRPVGGLHEKTVAALLAGVKRLLYPRRNLAEVLELPAEVRADVELVPVDTVEDALAHAWAAAAP